MLRQSHESTGVYPDSDEDWSEDDWRQLLDTFVTNGLLQWREIASLTLGHLNPSQVGTSIASKKSFQSHYPRRKCWAAVREWHFHQRGTCADCGTRLELQADHLIPKEAIVETAKSITTASWIDDPDDSNRLLQKVRKALTDVLEESNSLDESAEKLREGIASAISEAIRQDERDPSRLKEVADRLDNMLLRCRRCNVIRRPSHKHGGKTFLTAESALMWLLLVKRPSTYEAYQDMCRSYGLTMANIRFEEAWAMARWLNRISQYHISPKSKYASPLSDP